MSTGNGVIAGPEVDMTELDAGSSGTFAVDLNLNLGPSFALELALGGHEFEESVPVSRPNWPRFEPGMLAGGQEDEIPPLAEDQPPISVPREGQQDNAGSRATINDANDFDADNSQTALRSGIGVSEHEPRFVGLLQAFRNLRHLHHLRRDFFLPDQNLGQTQGSSDGPATVETRTVAEALDSAVSPDRSEEESGTVGSNFECNICLEMATEPVVTCCGHLFCWPCLYQWLHLHSNQKECPVCKGFLSDELITPIYGRGASQDAEKNIGSTPARPHAHRVNGKRHWTETYFQERVERGHPAADAELQGDRNEGDISNAAELVLDRLRAAQRLREYINERFRIRVQQRLMGRRGPRAFRLHPLSNLGAHIQASSSSSVESSDQHNNEQDLTQVATSNPELADNTAAVGGSTDGVHDGPEDGQRTLEHVSTLPTHLGNLNGNGGVDAGSSIMEQNPLQETSPLYVSAEDSNSSGHGASTDLQVESLHLPQSSRHENVNASSSSCDSDPSSLRTRKRRRLN